MVDRPQSQNKATVACFLVAVGLIVGVSLLSSFMILEDSLSFNSMQGLSMEAMKTSLFHELTATTTVDNRDLPSGEAANHTEEDSDLLDSKRYFTPGSLNLPRKEVLKKCYVDPIKYKAHKQGNMCTYSKKYDLFYLLLPKSGSSTGRHVMKADFDATEHSSSTCGRFMHGKKDIFGTSSEKTLKTISMRNPVSRFYASYDEMFVRKLKHPQVIPEQYNQFMKPFWNWKYEKYAALFETKEGIQQLTDTFETFVRDYDGKHPFDSHLTLQLPAVSNQDGFVEPFDYIIDTKSMTEQFEEIAKTVHAKKPHVIHGRSYPRRFDVEKLSRETIQKMCRLSLIDFCCLNYELPPACLEDDVLEGLRPRCEWIEVKTSSDAARGDTTAKDLYIAAILI